jgi:hypothetical protein
MGTVWTRLPELSAADVVPDGVDITDEIRRRASIPRDLRVVVEPVAHPHGVLVHAVRGKRHSVTHAAREQDLPRAVERAVREVSTKGKRSTP